MPAFFDALATRVAEREYRQFMRHVAPAVSPSVSVSSNPSISSPQSPALISPDSSIHEEDILLEENDMVDDMVNDEGDEESKINDLVLDDEEKAVFGLLFEIAEDGEQTRSTISMTDLPGIHNELAGTGGDLDEEMYESAWEERLDENLIDENLLDLASNKALFPIPSLTSWSNSPNILMSPFQPSHLLPQPDDPTHVIKDPADKKFRHPRALSLPEPDIQLANEQVTTMQEIFGVHDQLKTLITCARALNISEEVLAPYTRVSSSASPSTPAQHHPGHHRISISPPVSLNSDPNLDSSHRIAAFAAKTLAPGTLIPLPHQKREKRKEVYGIR
ncbi:hypothetical protein C8J56DRAFT_1047863 [Mycena floridula]|nr:hypothetical protein C8J56DRAFT_1047863 [Mycena floridula]